MIKSKKENKTRLEKSDRRLRYEEGDVKRMAVREERSGRLKVEEMERADQERVHDSWNLAG